MNDVLPNIYCGRVVVDRGRFDENCELAKEDSNKRIAEYFDEYIMDTLIRINKIETEIAELAAVERRANFFKQNDETNLLYELYERDLDDRICPICEGEMTVGIGVRTVESYGHRTVFKANICPTCIEMMADILRNANDSQTDTKEIIKKRRFHDAQVALSKHKSVSDKWKEDVVNEK